MTTTWGDGVYVFIVYTEPIGNKNYEINATISFKYKTGYLSANDWPFLPVCKKFKIKKALILTTLVL